MIEQAEISVKEQFLTHLQHVTGISESNQTQITIVGGIALRASMNKEVEFRRPNGTIPDIDIIGLGPNPENIKKTTHEINKYRQSNPDCPPVSLEPVTFSDQPKSRYSLMEMLSGLRKDSNDCYFLTFRGIDQEIDSLTMLPVSRPYGDVNIPTFAQETILNRYLVRLGYIKPKDQKKVEEFRQHIKITGGDGLDPKLFDSYKKFAQEINKKYPFTTNLTKAYWNFDQIIGGKISGSNGPIYNLIKSFRR